jgi:ribosome-binding protein aMBF1 (putative translation factor)
MDALFIRINRKVKGLTQQELALKIGCNVKTIKRWENRQSKISKKNMEKLKKYLTYKNNMLKMQ